MANVCGTYKSSNVGWVKAFPLSHDCIPSRRKKKKKSLCRHACLWGSQVTFAQHVKKKKGGQGGHVLVFDLPQQQALHGRNVQFLQIITFFMCGGMIPFSPFTSCGLKHFANLYLRSDFFFSPLTYIQKLITFNKLI